MIGRIVAAVSAFILGTIRTGGYAGVAGLMAIESACIPLPSELIMPFAGFLASQGRFSVWVLGLVGALGCVVGSIPAYYLGMLGGRPLIEKYGKWVLLSHRDLELATEHYSRSQLGGKQSAGFRVYRAAGARGAGASKPGGSPIDPHHLEWLR